MMKNIRILLVDDDVHWQKALIKFLDQEDDMVVSAVAGNAEEALKIARAIQIDIILMDINLNGEHFDGIKAAVEISQFSRAKIIMLTAMQAHELITDSFTAGAVNFIRKEQYRDLPAAIRSVYNNNSPWEVLLRDYDRLKKEEQIKNLTFAEREVFALIEKGLSRRQIQEHLCKSENTIKQTIKHILKKLQVKNTKEALQKINRKGLL